MSDDNPDTLFDKIPSKQTENPTLRRISHSFYRGPECNFNPYLVDYATPDFLENFLLKGWLPEQPWIEKSTRITAFGSCFAVNITKHLSNAGYNLTADKEPGIYVSYMGEGMVNVHALSQQFEWALEDKEPPQNLWHGYKAESFGFNPEIKSKTRAAFLQTDLFIITLGLSEVWYDEITGGVFWRAIPMRVYDSKRHKFRVCSMQETKEKISRIDELIRRHVPHARLLFTLSPIPLAATFRPISCISANSVSKAVLRSALDEFFRENPERVNKSLFYWPSFEVIQDLFPFRFGGDSRHPLASVLQLIMRMFEAAHCVEGPSLADIRGEYMDVRKRNIDNGLRLERAFNEQINQINPSTNGPDNS